jgi:glycosyltransferase involved in cell wall biosynthesis
VESILNQDFNDFELILVDDGSPDNCPKMCDAFAEKDSRVKAIHKPNGGASDARNVGIKSAVGDYLMFVDSDDYWNSQKVLSTIDDRIKKYNVDIVQFGQEKLYNREQKIVTGAERHLAQYNGYKSEDVFEELVKKGNMTISACSMAISRELIVNNHIYFVVGKRTEDLEWAIHLYTCESKWAFIDEFFYVYRIQREGSVTATIDYKHMCDYCWMLEKSIEHIESSETVKNPLMSYLMYQVLIAIALCYRVGLSKKQKKEILCRLKKICKDNVTKYTLNKKVKLASCIYRLGGYTLMAKVLGFYLNNRGR